MINADKLFADIVEESKLSSKERNKLDSSQFGLQKERKYPLNDETHIRSAITFFKFCPAKDRNELATNINKRLKELDLHIEVSPDNPFYKLSDKTYTTESAVLESVDFNLSDNGLPTKVPTDNDELIRLQNNVYERLSDACVRRPYSGPYSKEVYNRAKKLNTMMHDIYINYISFTSYNGKTNTSVLFYIVVKDVCDVLTNAIINDDIDTARKAYMILYNISIKIDCNFAHLRNSILICTYCMGLFRSGDEKYTDILYKLDELHHMCGDKHKQACSAIFVVADKDIMKLIFDSGIEDKFEKVIHHYYKLSHEKVDSIFEIPAAPLTHISDDDIAVGNLFIPDKLKKISKYNLSTRLTYSDIIRFNECTSYVDSIQCTTDCYGDMLYVGCKDTIKYILLSDTDDKNRLFMVELNKTTIDYFTTPISYKEKLNIIKLSFGERDVEYRTLTEGLSIDEDGNIKVTIKSTKSYMDEYSQNHKLLVENWKNKNYEGVKKNLAFVFALINIIERDKRYKNREPEIVKARAFAINDFKTYLNKLTEVEKDFDFVTYYNESDYDKLVVDIPKHSLVGLKMLVKTLLK